MKEGTKFAGPGGELRVGLSDDSTKVELVVRLDDKVGNRLSLDTLGAKRVSRALAEYAAKVPEPGAVQCRQFTVRAVDVDEDGDRYAKPAVELELESPNGLKLSIRGELLFWRHAFELVSKQLEPKL